MKKSTKRLLAIILAATLVCGIGVFAADIITTANNPTVVFDAAAKKFSFENVDKYGSNTYVDLFPDMKNMMPGDTVKQTINVKVVNAGQDTVKIVLRADANSDTGENTTNTDYDKLTSGKNPATLKVSYDKTEYAGTLDAAKLPDSAKDTDIGDSGVYLGAYTGNEGQKNIDVTFNLPIEAGNEYQGLEAKLGWVFIAEIIPYQGGGTEIPDENPPLVDLNTTDHYAYIIGRPDGGVHPEDSITRGEMATVFFRMLTDDSRTELWQTTNSFKDVSPTLWCNNAISTLTKGGILKGYTDNTFRADAPITRAEFAAMAVRFFDVNYEGEDMFTDISTSWARADINTAASAGIIMGYPDGTYRPNQAITRAEAVTIMNRVLMRQPSADHMLKEMITWPDNTVGAWYYADMQEATNSHDFELKTDDATNTEYEVWTKLQPVRDWAAFEKQLSDANSSTNPGEVISSATASK